jgi:hypothetical protein
MNQINPFQTSPLDYVKKRLEEGRWPVTPRAKQTALDLIQETMSDSQQKIQVRLRAIKLLLSIDTLNARRESIQVSREPKGVIHYKDLPTTELLAKLQELAGSLGIPPETLNSLLGPESPILIDIPALPSEDAK